MSAIQATKSQEDVWTSTESGHPNQSKMGKPHNMTALPRAMVRCHNRRGTAEQWLKEGKYALHWTRLSCHRFVANQVRLALFVLAYNLGNFLRRLALPASVRHWSLRSIQVKLIKIGGKVVHHARQVIFQMAEVAVSKQLFDWIGYSVAEKPW